MDAITRRDLLAAVSLAGSAILLGSPAGAAEPPAAVSFKYEPKPLPFNPAKLQGISEKLIVCHHDKNYAGAVKRLNAIQEKIAGLAADAPPFQMGALKREALIAMNSMINHELYFDNLGGDGKAAGSIKDAIARQFGSLEAWEHDFKLTGQALAGGSGWVTLAYSARDKKLHNIWSSDHQVGLIAGQPLMIMDMYEHAYQMDYGADANSYIAAFFANLNWEQVNKRAEGLKLA